MAVGKALLHVPLALNAENFGLGLLAQYPQMTGNGRLGNLFHADGDQGEKGAKVREPKTIYFRFWQNPLRLIFPIKLLG